MRSLQKALAIILLFVIAAMLLHNAVPHIHHEHIHATHEQQHAVEMNHSHDHDESDGETGWNLLSLLFAQHSHTVEVPNDLFVLLESSALQDAVKLLATADTQDWLSIRDGPTFRSYLLVCCYGTRDITGFSSLRAPPALG